MYSQYILNKNSYTIKNSMLWGNFSEHLKKVRSKSFFKEKCFHGLMVVLEFLPVLSQLVSLVELVSYKIIKNKSSVNDTKEVELDCNSKVICDKREREIKINEFIKRHPVIGELPEKAFKKKRELLKKNRKLQIKEGLTKNHWEPFIKNNILFHARDIRKRLNTSIKIKAVALEMKSKKKHYLFKITFNSEDSKNRYLDNMDDNISQEIKSYDKKIKEKFGKDKKNALFLRPKESVKICGVKESEAKKYLEKNMGKTLAKYKLSI